jgi:hypothetical protein
VWCTHEHILLPSQFSQSELCPRNFSKFMASLWSVYCVVLSRFPNFMDNMCCHKEGECNCKKITNWISIEVKCMSAAPIAVTKRDFLIQ